MQIHKNKVPSNFYIGKLVKTGHKKPNENNEIKVNYIDDKKDRQRHRPICQKQIKLR